MTTHPDSEPAPKPNEESIQSKGGKARKKKLTAEQLSAIGKKAIAARWSVPQTEYEGPLTFGSITFNCAVIEREGQEPLRVISQTDFMQSMGMYYSGFIAKQHREKDATAGLPMFLAQAALKPFVEKHLTALQYEPIPFRTKSGSTAKGIPAGIIPRICKVWVDANRAGVLGPRQKRIAESAEIVVDALLDVSIIALVDEATGYQNVRARGALQVILDAFLRKNFAAWSKRIPDEFYKEIYRLRGWHWPGMQVNRFQVVGKYTTDLIYKRLAPGIQEELERRNPKNEKGNRATKHHTWLTKDIGHPALREHMHAVLGFLRASKTWSQFKTMMDAAFPIQGSAVQFELNLPGAESAKNPMDDPMF